MGRNTCSANWLTNCALEDTLSVERDREDRGQREEVTERSDK